MMKSVKSIGLRFIAVLLTVLILISTGMVGLLTTAAAENGESGSEEQSQKYYTLVLVADQDVDAYCYWWDKDDNGQFLAPAQERKVPDKFGREFLIPEDAKKIILVNGNQWINDSFEDSDSIKLSAVMELSAVGSDKLLYDMEEKALSPYTEIGFEVKEQDEAPVIRPEESCDVVTWNDFTISGSFAPYIKTIRVSEGETAVGEVTAEKPFSYTGGDLGKHTFTFSVEDIAVADSRYTVYCKTDRTDLSFGDEKKVTMPFGEAQDPLPVSGLTEEDKVEYSSDDSEVAAVTSDGKIMPVGIGSCTITANIAENDTYFAAQLSYEVEVVAGKGEDFVDFTEHHEYDKPVELIYGETYHNPVVYDKDANPDAVVTYSSSDDEIASVDETGKVTTRNVSSTAAVITAKVTGLHNLSDAVVQYQVFVNKAEMGLPKDYAVSKTFTYAPKLEVKCADYLEIPITGYEVSYSLASQKSLEKEEIRNAAEIDENGVLKPKRSGVFTVSAAITHRNYEDELVNITVTVERAEREGFGYEENTRNMFVGCSFDFPSPKNYSSVIFRMAEEFKPFAKLEGNKVTALKQNTEGVVITANIDEDDCYKAAEAEYIVKINFFKPDENPPFTISGEKAFKDDDTKFVGDVTIKPVGNYRIALYREDAANNTELEFFDSLTLKNNVGNPKVVLQSNSSDEGMTGAISDVIETGIYLDHTAPEGYIECNAFSEVFSSLVRMITFNSVKPTATLTVTAKDKESKVFESGRDGDFGKVKIDIFVDKNMTEGPNKTVQDLEALDEKEWTAYSGAYFFQKMNEKLVVFARLTDPFGNRKYISTNGFVLDNTKPQVSASFDNNTSKEGYFNQPRTATFVVEDENFTPAEGMFAITAKDAEGNAVQPPEVEWTGNTATIRFEKDAEYELAVTKRFADRAGNKCVINYDDNTTYADKFVIDTTAPEVLVKYSNNDCRGEFFNGTRVATLKVYEPYFVADDKMIEVKATDGEQEIQAPVVVWNDREGTINFSAEGEYSVIVTDAFTDKAGNPAHIRYEEGTECPEKFIIDMTPPVVELSYDNNDCHETYFNSARTATITVSDKYFKSADNMIQITAVSPAGETMAPPEVKWDGDTATIAFTENGEYTLEFTDEFTDEAGNRFEKVQSPEDTKCPNLFVIYDKEPQAIISYNNNSVQNGKYFAKTRTATVEVLDEYFDGTTDMITVTAKDAEGKEIEAPAVSWEGNTGTIEFAADGVYTVSASEAFKDRAQNPFALVPAADTEAPFEFVVDTTAPQVKVVFTPTADVSGKYLKEEHQVTITVTDDNFDAASDMVQLTAKNINGEAVAVPKASCGGKSIGVIFEGDANYTLALTKAFKDKAGNNYELEKGSADHYSFCVDQSAPEPVKVEYSHSNEKLSGFWRNLVNLFTGTIVFFPDEVTVKITAKDSDSGISKIQYSAPVGGDQTGLTGVEEHTEENPELSEEFSTSFDIKPEYIGKVKAAAYNNAKLYTQTEDGYIAVSNSVPTISLSIKNQSDATYYNGKYYYNEDAILHVRVQDVFFDPAGQVKEQIAEHPNLVVKETTDGATSIVDISKLDWTRTEGTNEYTADIPLSAAGGKSVTVSYRNNFGKSAVAKGIRNFIIDKTKPKATISYDNNQVLNERFFAGTRTATISVRDKYFLFNEKSFDQSADNTEKMFRITAKDAVGNDVGQPEVELSEDKQSATIYFVSDANYTIEKTDKFTDIAANPAELYSAAGTEAPYEFGIDQSNPEPIEITYTDNTFSDALKNLVDLFTDKRVYFADTVKVQIKAKDIHSGIKRIKYSAPQDPTATEDGLNGGISLNTKENNSFSSEFIAEFYVPAEFKGRVQAEANNNAELGTCSNEGNIAVSALEPAITMEVLNPEKPLNHDGIDYYKNDVRVIITVEDVFFSEESKRVSAPDNFVVTEYTNDSEGVVLDNSKISWTRDGDSNRYYTEDVTLKQEGRKKLVANYKNNVGKEAPTQTIENLVLDKTKPVVSISYDNNDVRNDKYFNAKRKGTVVVQDDFFVGDDSMFNMTQSNKNGPVETSDIEYKWSQDKQSATIEFKSDGFYTFEPSVENLVDLAGNEAIVNYVEGTEAPNDFVVDTLAPNELKIEVLREGDTNPINSVKIGTANKDKPIFCNRPVTVTVTTNDALLNPEDIKLEYSAELSDGSISKTPYRGSFSFEPNLALTLTAYAEDKSGNKVQIHSDRVILDWNAPEIDGISPEITLGTGSNQPKIDKDGNKLFNGNVVVDYVITDRIYRGTCSGLADEKLKYEIFSNGTRTQDGTLDGAKEYFEGRLQRMTGSIAIDAGKNNSNFVELVVTAEDNAGNPAEDSAKLRIDITNPEINVSYSNNSSDSGYNEYFNASRTATIQIKERNFNEKKVAVKVTKDDVDVTPVLSWNHSGTANTDEYYHTAVIDYNDDADYTFDISYTDEADNPATSVNYGGSVSPTKFTVDKITPDIQVTYDNMDSLNSNYYKKERIATITVNEHNFDENRVTFSCTANDNGTSVTVPSLSRWTASGNVHTATVSFNDNALYVMNISINDMAGNAGNTVEEQRFYVDKEPPVIKLQGLENNTANKDEIISFTLTTSDHNLDASTYHMNFSRVDIEAPSKDMFTSSHESRGATEIVYKEQNLENDGIYKITCEVTDMAGNSVKTTDIVNAGNKKIGADELLFSVNRYGSTFSIKDDVRDIVDIGYVKSIDDDIIITEINPDLVDKYAVSLTTDGGQPKALREGESYTRVLEDDDKSKWKHYIYSVNQENFSDEGAYSLAITSTDKAENTSFSETKNPEYSKEPAAKISFVVDRTIPKVVVNNLEDGGHYNVEKQSVEIVANDDNLLQEVVITLNGETVQEYTGDELLENSGRMSLDIDSSESLQNLTVVAVDAARNSTEDTEETAVHFENFLVTTNLLIQFINNPILVISSIAGVLLIAGGIVFLAVRKKKKA